MNRLVVVSALWCPSCLILKKHLKKLCEEYTDLNVKVLDYDFDEEEVKKYDVGETLPVIIILNDDKEVTRLVGEKDYDEIVAFLKENNLL